MNVAAAESTKNLYPRSARLRLSKPVLVQRSYTSVDVSINADKYFMCLIFLQNYFKKTEHYKNLLQKAVKLHEEIAQLAPNSALVKDTTSQTMEMADRFDVIVLH